jgi:transcriptional regulator with XRE-family HTH domain
VLEQPAFGARLKALRGERGLSQAAVAKGGLSTGYLSRLEAGTRPPTPRVVRHLAARLGVPESAFALTAPSDTLARALAAAASVEPGQELPDDLARALATGTESGELSLRWQALWLLARACADRGAQREAKLLLVELLAVSEELDDPVLRARALVQLSRNARLLGDQTEALDHARAAYDLTPSLPAPDRVPVLATLVPAEAEAGRLGDARAHAEELCGLAAPRGGTARVSALWTLSTVLIRQGDHPAAKRALEEALDTLSSHDDLVLWMRLRMAAASLYLQSDPREPERARQRLDEVDPVVALVGAERHHQQATALRAQLAFSDGDHDTARELCDRIDARPSLLSFRDNLRHQALRGQLLVLDGRTADGVRMLHELAQHAQRNLNLELAAEIWRTLATILARDDRPGEDTA